MLPVERLCVYIIRLLHAPICVYDGSGKQIAAYIDCCEQRGASCSAEFLRLLLDKRQQEYPVLHLEAEGIVYGIIASGEDTYILGPCRLEYGPAAAVQHMAPGRPDASEPCRISWSSFSDFCELLLMLFEAITGIRMGADELYLRCFCGRDFELALREKAHQILYTVRETAAIHNPYGQEMREQESIRTGNLEALHRSFQETYAGKVGRLSRDPLRHTQNLAIVLITLACRSAIAGGLLPEVAFSMSDAFIQQVEEMKHVGEAYALGRQAEIEYCTAVRNLSSASSRRKSLITRCKELVVQQLHSKLTVQSLARQLEITPGYLSHLFIKEEAVKLTEYISREKIRAARDRLIYTEDTLDSIAFSLGFVSQSHFGQTFKRWTGMTPKQYRETYGRHLQE